MFCEISSSEQKALFLDHKYQVSIKVTQKCFLKTQVCINMLILKNANSTRVFLFLFFFILFCFIFYDKKNGTDFVWSDFARVWRSRELKKISLYISIMCSSPVWWFSQVLLTLGERTSVRVQYNKALILVYNYHTYSRSAALYCCVHQLLV